MQKALEAKTRMVRKQVYITAEQDLRLKERARIRGVAAAELVRAGIERELEAPLLDMSDDWRQRVLDLAKRPAISDATAKRIRQNKVEQAKLWNKRVAKTRRLLKDI
jgi:hypothetical protein